MRAVIKLRIPFLILSIIYILFSCDQNHQPITTDTPPSVIAAIKKLDSIHKYARKSGNLSIAIDSIHSVLSNDKSNDIKIASKGYSILGEFHARTGSLDSGKIYLSKALKIQLDLKDTIRAINISNNLGNTLSYQDSFGKAIQIYSTAYQWATHLRDTSKMTMASSNMSSAYISLDMPRDAITILKDAKRLHTNSESDKHNINSSLGRAYNKLGFEFADSTYFFYNIALKHAIKTDEARTILSARLNAASAAWKVDGKESSAIDSLTKLLDGLNTKEYSRLQYTILSSLIRVNQKIKDIENTEKYVNEYKKTISTPLEELPDTDKQILLEACIFVERNNANSKILNGLIDSSLTIVTRIHKTRTQALKYSGNRQAYIKNLQLERTLSGNEISSKTNELTTVNNRLRNQFAILLLSLGILLLVGLLYRKSKKAHLETKIEREKVKTLNRELNHRTSNQISLAYELILDQRRQIGDEQAKASLGRSESQLMALREVNRALAHRSDDLVRADEVLTKVAEGLQAASPHPFKLDLQLKAITVHGNAASRSALILSELLSNSIKYAFPKTTAPLATITISQNEQRTEISYLDNGPGPDGTVQGTGVGSGLIEAMLEDLDAEFEEIKDQDGKGYGMKWSWG